MNAPELRHAPKCGRPEARKSDSIFDRDRTLWRCPECGAIVTTTKDVVS